MVKLLISIVRLYQKYLSPLFGRRCRFYPTCSQYTIEVLHKYGLVVGLFKAVKRIIKCNPFHPGGYDPA
ncbi:membrane protein insertion efficiency factor YidD [Desulfitibacter alkalitolerans]|uniref:membrane protein insertion efficiency factor YidD n=1 Tax=Desulfitibacter alkalitolerans TaxID=264641 RepID=UPI0004832071|nr:membrane protein insertion efficiency factor YidD [Desulfitibacter alkalitolerans]